MKYIKRRETFVRISMGFSNKEIAELTNRSIRTIESVKYTIRKKLNIEGPVETYLQKLKNL